MGLFDFLFPKAEEQMPKKYNIDSDFRLLTAYKPVFTTYSGSIYEDLLVRSAIEAKARHISKLKVEMQGSAQEKLKTRIKHYPNPWMTWSQFLARASTILDCTNNLFIVPVQDKYFNTIGFFPVLPEKVELKQDKNGEVWVSYEFRHGIRGAVEFDRCAFLCKHQYKSDFFGENNHALDSTMDLISIQDQAIEEAMKNSATFRFMARINNFTSDEDLALERKRFNEYNLHDDEGGVLLFPNTYTDIKQIESKAYSVDENQQEMIKTNVYNYFGVNEEVLQGRATSDQLDAFFNLAIEPFAIALSEAMSRAIYTDRERSEGNHIYVNANRLQYMTASEKVNMAQQLGDRGILTINEVRELFNYAPIPGGDIAFIRGEYYPLADKTGDVKGEDENEQN